MCNLAPDNRSVTEVLLPSDSAFLSIHALFSLSSGFCFFVDLLVRMSSSLLRVTTILCRFPNKHSHDRRPEAGAIKEGSSIKTILSQVEGDEEKTLAASILVFSLVFGLFLGAASSYVWVRLLWSLCSLTWETRVNLMRTYLSHLMNGKKWVGVQFSLYFHLTKNAKYLYQDFKVSIVVGHMFL